MIFNQSNDLFKFNPLKKSSFQKSNEFDFYQIEMMARLNAKEDYKHNGIIWGIGSFGISVVLTPFIGGGITTLIAYNIKGNTSVPTKRYDYINSKYGEDAYYFYKSVYELERGELQKKGNGRAALIGAGTYLVMAFMVFLDTNQ